MKYFLSIFLSLLLLGCNNISGNAIDAAPHRLQVVEPVYKVIGIKDGDTFVLLMNGKEQVIRLAHIDCPERKQPFGTKAKQFASDLCFGKEVALKHSNKYDRNKRLIAEVILNNGINVNQELIKNGLACHFKKYSSDTTYARLEIEAMQKSIGIWSDSSYVAPWDFRKQKIRPVQ